METSDFEVFTNMFLNVKNAGLWINISVHLTVNNRLTSYKYNFEVSGSKRSYSKEFILQSELSEYSKFLFCVGEIIMQILIEMCNENIYPYLNKYLKAHEWKHEKFMSDLKYYFMNDRSIARIDGEKYNFPCLINLIHMILNLNSDFLDFIDSTILNINLKKISSTKKRDLIAKPNQSLLDYNLNYEFSEEELNLFRTQLSKEIILAITEISHPNEIKSN